MLLEGDLNGRPIPSEVSQRAFPTIAKASAAAKTEAFALSSRLGVPVAVAIADRQERVLIRHVVPAMHCEHTKPLYRGSLRTA